MTLKDTKRYIEALRILEICARTGRYYMTWCSNYEYYELKDMLNTLRSWELTDVLQLVDFMGFKSDSSQENMRHFILEKFPHIDMEKVTGITEYEQIIDDLLADYYYDMTYPRY